MRNTLDQTQKKSTSKNQAKPFRYYNFMVDGKPTAAVDMVRVAAAFHAKSDDGAITIEHAAWALTEHGYVIEARRKS
jgi:hypothetical protein